jgi:hypothetical protein
MNIAAAPAPIPFSRTIPVVSPNGTTRIPLMLVLGYVLATFLLFLLWPINWPIYYFSDWVRLVGYVTLCFAVIGGATFYGSAGETRVAAPLPLLQIFLLSGAGVAAALLEPSSYAYTGKKIWEVMDALRNQGAAYHQLQIQLVATTGQRNTFVIIRALTSPLTYAVLPLGIVRWRTIGWSGRLSVLMAVACSVIFSIMRGTDKEIADLFVIGVSAAFVSYGRNRTLGAKGFEIFRRYWKPAVVALLFFWVAQGLFTTRKDERLGGYVSRTTVCANDSHICADLDNPLIAWLPQRQKFGLTIFILSTCSGYYGLELALEKPFYSTYGAGHSPAALSAYEVATGDPTLHLQTFTYRNGADHWSDENYWSTLMTWIANDVGFGGTIPVLALIAYCWGRWWREAAAGLSDPAAVLFSLTTMMMVYLPANNQVLASYDGYVVFAVWISIWLWHRSRFPLSVATTALTGGST